MVYISSPISLRVQALPKQCNECKREAEVTCGFRGWLAWPAWPAWPKLAPKPLAVGTPAPQSRGPPQALPRQPRVAFARRAVAGGERGMRPSPLLRPVSPSLFPSPKPQVKAPDPTKTPVPRRGRRLLLSRRLLVSQVLQPQAAMPTGANLPSGAASKHGSRGSSSLALGHSNAHF